MAPPSYLSEDEALRVILEEMRERGDLRSWDSFVTWSEVTLPRRNDLAGCEPVPRIVEDATHRTPLHLDGWDAEHKIGFKLVSRTSYAALGGVVNRGCTAYTVDTKAAAREVAAEVAKSRTAPAYFGTFYDPLTKGPSNGQVLAEQQAAARYLLRSQVRDFVEWLKAQGAI